MGYARLDPSRSGEDLTPTQKLVLDLTSHNGLTRARAREKLVELGSPATEDLIEALSDPRVQLRWEAAKALSEIGDPGTADSLVRTLRDEDFGVRWLAAEGLIVLGPAGLRSLLDRLSGHLVSERLREGAHHVVRGRLDAGDDSQALRPLLEALGGFRARESAPLAARRARTALGL